MVFVAMPFGKKRDPRTGIDIDFDAIYRDGIQPAVAGLNVDLIRADEERGGGIVHKPMFERLLISEIAIVDVTIENANVYYELGVRHTARPRSTIILRAHGTQLPFDIKLIRALGYELENGTLTEAAAKTLNAELSAQLQDALKELDEKPDSPLFQLIPAFQGMIDLPHAVTENFRDRAKSVNSIRERLSAAGKLPKDQAIATIDAIAAELGDISSFNAESAVDVVLAYRDVEAYSQMIALTDRFPRHLIDHNQVIREQYALALNRRRQGNDRDRALEMLVAIVKESGDNPETCGLIGRIYKDMYREALATGDEYEAPGSLALAIDWYRRGFNADPRDYYPGINLATLLVLEGSEKSQEELRRVAAALSFALARLNAIDSRDYWTLATVVESAVLDNDWTMVNSAMGRLVSAGPKLQQLTTTRNNLELIANAKIAHIDAEKLDKLIGAFTTRIDKLAPPAPEPAKTV
jgi:tetratricopeptide (TPR) repeat protein